MYSQGSADRSTSLWGVYSLFISCIAWKFKQSLNFSLFHCCLLQAQNIEREVHFLSLLDTQFFVYYRCRQTGVRVGSFWPCFSIGHSLQLCFSSLWLELITEAFPMQHEKRRKLKVSVSGGWKQNEKRGKRGQNCFLRPMDVEWIVVLLAKEVCVSSVCPPPPKINNISTSQSPEMYSVHIEWR